MGQLGVTKITMDDYVTLCAIIAMTKRWNLLLPDERIIIHGYLGDSQLSHVLPKYTNFLYYFC